MCKFRDFDKYEVYPDGRIWSYSRNKFLKPFTNKKGYKLVTLNDNECKQKTYLLHRVVYEAVTGKPIPEGYEVNHISEAKNENSFERLNLLTHKENLNFGTRNARASKSLKNSTKLSKQVGAFKNDELILSFPSTAEAHRNGFNSSAVSACCRNCFNRPGNNVYKGYTWKYL